VIVDRSGRGFHGGPKKYVATTTAQSTLSELMSQGRCREPASSSVPCGAADAIAASHSRHEPGFARAVATTLAATTISSAAPSVETRNRLVSHRLSRNPYEFHLRVDG
jgi:hypothetical protein